ncbi:MAG: helix-turn-helix transcriptional regulator [Lachnospiraceae bacterium]|nr:helix-turn-helix transcriptional regulator [Lachnospiraceae bacterium]
MNAEKTGDLIAKLRKEKGWTQKELAEALQITDKAVSKWERGKSMPDLWIMQSICQVFEISITELLTGKKGEPDETAGATLLVELVDREKRKKLRRINFYFGGGSLILIGLLFYEGIWRNTLGHAPMAGLAELLFLAGLGLALLVAGFYENNRDGRKKTFSRAEIEVLTGKGENRRMKSAEELLQFARKSQRAELGQYRKAFETIAENLREEEYGLFSLVGESYTVNDSPGPWHIALAVTNERILLSGETVSGRMFTRYTLDVFCREEIRLVYREGRKLIFDLSGVSLKIEGEDVDKAAIGLMEMLKR